MYAEQSGCHAPTEQEAVVFIILDSSQKEFWKLINKQGTTIPVLWDGSTPVTLNGAKAELLISHFYECFNHSL